MSAQLIRLQRGEWRFDPDERLGEPGGFGEVFKGVDADGQPIAVKRLKVRADQAAQRELRIAERFAGRDFQHVVPILDAGLDAETDWYFVVMPRASHSLADTLAESGNLDEETAIEVLRSIAAGLAEVTDIVHRDLKPANVLFYKDAWRIADFGIARFVEEATSANTVRGFLSDPYAAPEQWLGDATTAATDVYALGCVAHALINGRPPFSGPGHEDYKRQHVEEEPPPLEANSARLRALVLHALRKLPETRPPLGRFSDQLTAAADEQADEGGGSGVAALREAAANAANRVVKSQGKRAAEHAKEVKREVIRDHAFAVLDEIADALKNTLESNGASVQDDGRQLTARVGNSWLQLKRVGRSTVVPEFAFPKSGWDVIGFATITVGKGAEEVHGASLWYAKLTPDDAYRWYEASYRGSVLLQRTDLPRQPSCLTDFEEVDFAHGGVMRVWQKVSGPTPIDDEHVEGFCDAWAHRLAGAYDK